MKLSELNIRGVPKTLKDKMKRIAKENERSMNKQVLLDLKRIYSERK